MRDKVEEKKHREMLSVAVILCMIAACLIVDNALRTLGKRKTALQEAEDIKRLQRVAASSPFNMTAEELRDAVAGVPDERHEPRKLVLKPTRELDLPGYNH